MSANNEKTPAETVGEISVGFASPNDDALMTWFFLFFICSGYCSLVYEVVWLRLALAQFGVTTAMVSIILSIFMGGIGLGSWVTGKALRRSDGIQSRLLLQLYGFTELVIGISGLIMPGLLRFGHARLLGIAQGNAWDSVNYYVLSGAWIGISLIPACFFMGATIPLAMAAIKKNIGRRAETSFSFLYLANLVGASIGTLVSAFALVEIFGFRGTLHLTSALNCLLAICALLVSLTLTPANAFVPSAYQTTTSIHEIYGMRQATIMGILFVTGLVSMGMEVVWIRQFTPYLGNVVYAFATILAIYLVASFVGARVYRMWVRVHDPQETGLLWLMVGAAGLLPLLLADPRLPISSGVHEVAFLRGALRALVGVAPFSALLGFLTPMLVDIRSNGDPQKAGGAYAINVLGCILGPLIAGFLLLPWVREGVVLSILAVPLFTVGLLAEFLGKKADQSAATRPLMIRVGLILAASLTIALFTKDYETRFHQRVSLRDYTAAVVATGSGMRKNLVVNGIGMTILTPTTKLMAHVPLALLNGRPQSALVICFGMGTTFRSLLSWGIHTTAVELVPSVPKMFWFFHSDGPELMKSPSARVVIDDGRRFLEGSTDEFDVITLDPPPPVGAPTSSLLYSVEFDEIAKKHLRPGGILQTWLPGGDAATKASVARAFKSTFPFVRVFHSIEKGDLSGGLHFIGSAQPLANLDARALAERLPPNAVRDLVEWGPASTADDQMKLFLGGELALDSLISAAGGVPALQDDRPINEYFFLRWDLHYSK